MCHLLYDASPTSSSKCGYKKLLLCVFFIACTVCLFFSCSWNMTQTVKNIQGGRKTMMTVMRQMKMKMTRMMTGPRSGAGPDLQ